LDRFRTPFEMVTVVPFATTILSVADPSGSITGSERGMISSCWTYTIYEEAMKTRGEEAYSAERLRNRGMEPDNLVHKGV
jgi:hypothetical protein